MAFERTKITGRLPFYGAIETVAHDQFALFERVSRDRFTIGSLHFHVDVTVGRGRVVQHEMLAGYEDRFGEHLTFFITRAH